MNSLDSLANPGKNGLKTELKTRTDSSAGAAGSAGSRRCETQWNAHGAV